jgi:hypothetical protein
VLLSLYRHIVDQKKTRPRLRVCGLTFPEYHLPFGSSMPGLSAHSLMITT